VICFNAWFSRHIFAGKAASLAANNLIRKFGRNEEVHFQRYNYFQTPEKERKPC